MLLKTLGTLLISAISIAKAQTNQTPVTNSGKVLDGYINAYVIFYGDWTSSNAATDQKTFLNFIDDVYSTSWFSILDQYTNEGSTLTRSLNLAAALTDSGSQGLTLSDRDAHKKIVVQAVQSGYLSESNQLDSNGIYIIVGGPNVDDAEFCNRNCGYNSYSDLFQYIFIGYSGKCPDKCVPVMNKDVSPNNSPFIDAAITLLSHELQDIITDPRMDAWIIHPNNDGNTNIELGDFCSGGDTTEQTWFGNMQKTSNGASYNIATDNNKYLVQSVFSKKSNACLVAEDK
ncbi:unnamed protein product [Cunninghamella blakesleeana]